MIVVIVVFHVVEVKKIVLYLCVKSGGQESYPLRIFTLGRSGRWTAAGRSSAGRQTADGRSSDGRPAGRPGGARVVSGAEKKII